MPITKNEDQFVNLYLKWIDCPKIYEHEMSQTIERLVKTVLKKSQLYSVYKRYEDYDDLVMELKKYCYEKLLPRVKDPTNKRLFNYFYWSLFRLIQRRRKRATSRNNKENLLLSRTKYSSLISYTETPIIFPEKLQTEVAALLIEGYTHPEIIKKLGITQPQLKNTIQNIKIQYMEMGYGKR